jgi:hypothetical protein
MYSVKKTRRRSGRVEVLCGGYVRWDTRKKDNNGWPIRTEREVRVWMPAGNPYDDCGYWTNLLVETLKDKVGPKPNIEVSECWQY